MLTLLTTLNVLLKVEIEQLNEQLLESAKLELQIKTLSHKNELLLATINRKDSELSEAEQYVKEHQLTIDSLRKEIKDLKAQIVSWSEQYNYINESTSIVIEKNAKKQLEVKNSEQKYKSRVKRLEEENEQLRADFEMSRGEVSALNQTISMLRNEHQILVRMKDDLENRLMLTKDRRKERPDDLIKSINDSQLDQSLGIDSDIHSGLSFRERNESLNRQQSKTVIQQSRQILSQAQRPMKKISQQDLLEQKQDISSGYCKAGKCEIF